MYKLLVQFLKKYQVTWVTNDNTYPKSRILLLEMLDYSLDPGLILGTAIYITFQF